MRRRPSVLLSVAVAAVVVLPAAAVVSRALGTEGRVAAELARARVLPLLATTLGLALGASLVAVAIGLAAATLTVRRRFPGRVIAIALLASPLAVPPYLVAQLWLEVTGPGGPLQPWLGGRLFGHLATAIVVIGLCTSPLPFLVIRAAMERLDRTWEEAAATLGLSPRQRFWRLVVPSLRPAWLAGFGLVAMYACADFGAVSALGAKTFTREIFFQMDLNLNRAAARDATAVLSLVLLVVAVPLLAMTRWSASDRRFEHARGERRRTAPTPLSPLGQVGAWALVAAVAGPTSVLVVARCAVLLGRTPDAAIVWRQAADALLSSALWAGAAATLAVLGAGALAWIASRVGGRAANAAVPLASLGYVLPGPVVALGLLVVLTGVAPLRATLYGTSAALVLAWIVRFLPEALQAVSAGLEQAPRQLEEAARTLGDGPARALVRVTLPLVAGSLAAGWVFVFSASMRELPAALLLKPLGARTLSSEIWSFAQDSHYADMAPSATLLVLFSVPAVTLLVTRKGERPPR